MEAEPVRPGAGAQPHPLEQRPGLVEHAQQVTLGARRRVVDVDVQAHPQEVERPAAADHPGADDSHPAHLARLRCHHRTS